MGDCLHGNEFGVAEGCTRDNWAAEYAKKLFDTEALARKGADETLQKQITDNKSAIEKEASDRDDAISKALHNEINRVDPIIENSCQQAVLDAKRYTDDEVEDVATYAQNERNRIENDVIARLANRVADAATAIGDKQDASFNYSGYTSVAHIASAVNKNVAEINNIQAYQTTPTRVGAWVDGTPIWRVAIPLTAMSEIGIDVENSAWRIHACDILYRLGVIAAGADVISINDRLCFQTGDSYDGHWYAAGINLMIQGWYGGEPTLLEDDGAQYFYGWIEFATDRGNLTSDEVIELPSTGFDDIEG